MDIYDSEQKVYDNALAHLKEAEAGQLISADKYAMLLKEYGRLLSQTRRSTRISDRTMQNLNDRKLNLQAKVHIDELTGIYNRRYLNENLARLVGALSRSDNTLSLLMLDIDYFKKYNDRYGHGQGDICLRLVAAAAKSCLKRPDDFVARYGGEEFVVVLPNTDAAGTGTIAESILQAVYNLNIAHEMSEVAPFVTVSVGGTSTKVLSHEQDVNLYLKRADDALYMSKNQGRNRYTYLELNIESETLPKEGRP